VRAAPGSTGMLECVKRPQKKAMQSTLEAEVWSYTTHYQQ